MKRFAVFAIVGPPAAAFTLFLILLPVAGVLEGVPVEISTPVLPAYCYAVLAALVIALFDWALIFISSIIGAWFVAIGLLGALPGFLCSWVVMKISKEGWKMSKEG